MSFVKDMLFGESAQPSTVQSVNTNTPMQNYVNNESLARLNHIISNFGKPGSDPVYGTTPAAAVPVGSNEQQLLDAIMASVTGDRTGASFGASTDALTALTRPSNAISPIARGDLATDGLSLVRDILSGRTMNAATNPALAASISTAQRPILEQFADAEAILRSNATRAGQSVAPRASSPFEAAQMRLQGNLADALGDVGTRLVAENQAAERQRQLEILGLQSGAFESGANRILTSAQAIPTAARGQLDAITSALESQALPRLIEQYGVEQGTAEFNRQQQQFIQMLQLALQGTSGGNTAVSLPGTEGSTGMLGSILGAIGTGIGGPLGGALGGKLATAIG